jgi:hypothetical protein
MWPEASAGKTSHSDETSRQDLSETQIEPALVCSTCCVFEWTTMRSRPSDLNSPPAATVAAPAVAVAPAVVGLAAEVVAFVSESFCARMEREQGMSHLIAAAEKKIPPGLLTITPRSRKE